MTSLAPVSGSSLRTLFRLKYAGWCVLLVMALAVLFIVDLPMLNAHHPARPYFFKVRWPLLPHMIFGGIAILSGPVQFSSRVRRQYPQFHRILGRFYVGSIMIAAPMGIVIPLVGPKDPFFTTGVIVHGSLWFVTTLMAFLTARNRHILQHKQWMVRSYILTFSFVITRVLSPLWPIFHVSITQYGMIDVILNVLYLLVADIALNWREISTRRA